MKKNAWKKDAHPGESRESKADKNRWWRVTKRISIIQDAEESSDNDIILNCIEGDCSDDEDLLDSGMDPDTDSTIVDQNKYSDYNYTEPFKRLELRVWFHPPAT